MNQSFESDLSALFDEAPAFDDTAEFAAAVAARIERKARLRVWLTWGAAAVGALFAGFGLAQGVDLDLTQVVTDAANAYGPATLWLWVGVALAVWAALPMLSGSEA